MRPTWVHILCFKEAIICVLCGRSPDEGSRDVNGCCMIEDSERIRWIFITVLGSWFLVLGSWFLVLGSWQSKYIQKIIKTFYKSFYRFSVQMFICSSQFIWKSVNLHHTFFQSLSFSSFSYQRKTQMTIFINSVFL